MSEQAFSADAFGGDVDFEVEVSPEDLLTYADPETGESYLLGDPEMVAEVEREQLRAEVVNHELDAARADVRETWPDMPEGVVNLLSAEDGESLRDLAATVAHRLGLTRADASEHPGIGPSRAQQLPGENALQKAAAAARQGLGAGAWMALKDAAAYAASGAPLTERQAERVRYAMNFARQVGDSQAVEFLARQLGESR